MSRATDGFSVNTILIDASRVFGLENETCAFNGSFFEEPNGALLADAASFENDRVVLPAEVDGEASECPTQGASAAFGKSDFVVVVCPTKPESVQGLNRSEERRVGKEC